MAVAAETRMTHRPTRVRMAPASAPRSLSHQVRDNRSVVARLQDSAKHGGTIQSPQLRSSTRRPFFCETNRPRTQFSDMRQETLAPASTTAGVVSARNAIGSTSSLSSPSTRTGKQVRECLRKCKNYPGCGDGEHWDWQCIHRGNTSNQVKCAYYAEPHACESENDDGGDMADTLIDELEPQASLEQEYEHIQNAYLATQYLEEKGLGFMGTHKSIRAKTHRPSMTCRNCAAVFTSNNKLHKHLRDPCKGSANFMDGGSQSDKNALPIVVESRAVVAKTPTEGLADFHYALAFWYVTPGGNPHMSCIDSGFGNSAIDDALQQRLYPDASRLPLPQPRVVEGLGGAECTATHVVLIRMYLKGIDGRYAQIIRPFHIFKNLSVPSLIGNDIMKPEKFDLLYSSNHLRIGTCDGIYVQITIHSGPCFNRIPVRCTTATVIPAGTSAIVGVKFARTLEKNQDYQFTPLQTHSAIAGAGAPHAVVRHDQSGLLYTNFDSTPLSIFKGTILGHVRLLETASSLSWAGASEDIKALFGITQNSSLAMTAVEAFNPHQTDILPDNIASHELQQGIFQENPRPRPIPAQSRYDASDSQDPCANELFECPQWLEQDYIPRYEHVLTPYIKVPDVATSTWKQVVVNTEDEISATQVAALKSLVHQHRSIFNDVMECVRKPEEDWLRIEVPAELEVNLKPTGLYRLNARGRAALDKQFNLNRKYGRMAALDKPSPWDLKVFVVYRGTKAWPVVDMRKLNAAMIGDAYPLPQQENVIQAMQGMQWLGSADITSAFYQRLIYPPTAIERQFPLTVAVRFLMSLSWVETHLFSISNV